MPDPAQPSPARLAWRACALLKAVHAGAATMYVDIEDSLHAVGVDALIVTDRMDGRRWLLLPGTGYGGGWLERCVDWARNVASVLPYVYEPPVPPPAAVANVAAVPVPGKSGRYWGRGFLDGANAVDDWLDRGAIKGVTDCAGYSQGGAILAILAWTRSDIVSAQAIAPARSCFSGPQQSQGLHSWISEDDLVPRVPLGASHVGEVHLLADLHLAPIPAHSLTAYRRQIGTEVRLAA